jgi:hypothetical protein
LVYDPNHTGVITSAHQLFGPWAFGGKRVASLEHTVAQKWSSGFEALAQLDHNGDGSITGGELEPLGLWFDENRDAISQPGEVQPINKAGVVALRVSFERTDPKTGDLISSVGYDRMVDGTIVSGPSIDWIARGASSAKDLALDAALSASKGAMEELLALAPLGSERTEAPANTSNTAARKAHELVAGGWIVHIDGDAPKQGLSGVLIFNGGDTPALNGTSFIELGANNAGAASRAVRFTSVEGTVEVAKDGTGILSFVTSTQGSRIENKATVNADGATMKGTSVATRTGGTELRYAWTAQRLRVPSKK